MPAQHVMFETLDGTPGVAKCSICSANPATLKCTGTQEGDCCLPCACSVLRAIPSCGLQASNTGSRTLALRYNAAGGADMKLNTLAFAIASAILWGLAMLGMTLANFVSGTYGQQFLQLMSSVYPGYHATRNIAEVIVGTLYGVVDAFICGAVLAWLYNHLGASPTDEATPLQTVVKVSK